MNSSILLSTEISIPEAEIKAIKIRSNTIHRFYNTKAQIYVDVYKTEFSDIFELRSLFEPPFNIFYIKTKNSKAKTPENTLCLRVKNELLIQHLDIDTQLTWEQSSLSIHDKINSPQMVLSSWIGKFQFKEDNPEINQVGLRRPQLGALHAISAYFTSERNMEPVTIVLPTGTGKTETMLAALVYQKCPKLLVVVPSNALREQISNKFHTLGCLPNLGVVPRFSTLPYVTKLQKGIKTASEALELAVNTNVIIATASILNRSNSEAIDILCEQCSHLFIDEAHHISAKSWVAVRDRFIGKKVVQFTATPFRNDKESLGGKIIFNYSMGEAQKAGYFKTINLYPVEEYIEHKTDIAIASKAIVRLREDLEAGYDHLMMVRVNKKERAEQIYSIYCTNAKELNPIIIHSDISVLKNKEHLAQLESRASRIVICVDMLGEGYDLPNLKIAAIHDYHKSLAITLQFIGRFTRAVKTKEINDASVIVNIADPSTEEALKQLYAQDADWDVVLRRLSENRIDREIRLQDVVDSLKKQGGLSRQLSLWNLTPSFSVMMFKTDCEYWLPEKYEIVLPRCEGSWYALAEDKDILVVLVVQSLPVKWGNFKELNEVNYKLLIAHWDKNRNALFIFSNDYKVFRPEILAKKLCSETAEPMSGLKIFNVLNNIAYPLVKNLGASQVVGAISFTQFFGANVTEGLSSVEKSSSELSNIAALGYENGERVIWGCSKRKGKVWSPQKSGSITDWIDWATSAWDKVIQGEPEDTNITREFLRPKRISQNHSSVPFSAQWGEYMLMSYENRAFVIFGDEAIPLYNVDLKVRQGRDNSVEIIISSNVLYAIYMMSIDDKKCTYSLIEGKGIHFQLRNSEPKEFTEQMMLDPIFIYYCDGSFSYNYFHVEIPNNICIFKTDKINVLDWDGINIQKESMGHNKEKDSIQFKTFSEIESSYDIIINDDGSGEAADLIALRLLDKEIMLHLYHCKYSSSKTSGARLQDLYEVCGQAQRCVRWKHIGLHQLYMHIKNREQLWTKKNKSRFVKGNIAQLADFKNMSRNMPIKFHVTIVQPGISLVSLTEEMLKLLGTTELFIKKTTQADLEVICSN